MVRSDSKAKSYEFDTKKAASIQRAKLVKFMKSVPNMKVRFESKIGME
jgi:hypothetical protein